MVKEAYNDIAPHFAETRENVWPPTRTFIEEVSPCKIADLGCGTGRSLIEAGSRGCSLVGVDSSERQLEIASSLMISAGINTSVRLIESDLEELPLENGELDAGIMIASLHHLPVRDSRISALNEAYRCIRNGGRLQVSVWTWDQERFKEKHVSRSQGTRELDEFDGPLLGDFMVPWKKGTYQKRFYHLYGPGELEKEIFDSHWILQRSYFDGRNHWAECIKVL